MRQAVLLVALLLMPCAVGFTQNSGTTHNRRGGGNSLASDAQFGQRRNEPTPEEQRMEREHDKQMAKERQAAIQRDTDKLLVLATELKEYVDKTNQNILSLDVMKKAEEIEKLARQVKEKMKTSR